MEAGYGTWVSPITSKLCTESGVDIMLLEVDRDPHFSGEVNIPSFWIISSSTSVNTITRNIVVYLK